MKNYLIINQPHTIITALNIPNDFPMVTIIYKSKAKNLLTKKFIIRDISFKSFTINNDNKAECLISFIDDNTNHNNEKFIPSELIEDRDLVDKFIGFISILLRLNDKLNPEDIVDINLYKKKHNSIIKSMCNKYFNKDKDYIIYSDDINGIYKISECTSTYLILTNTGTNIKIDLKKVLCLNMKFNEVV